MSRIIGMVAALCLATAVHPQAELSEDLFPRVISLDREVHFFGTEGDSALVPAGTYLVTASDDEIQLFNLRTADNFDIHAVAGTHDEEIAETTAMSVAGTEETPDAHEIVLMQADGTEVSAVGSYSGIQPRGLLGDAKRKADAARVAAQRRALEAKRKAAIVAAESRRRAEQLAEEARTRIDQGAAAARAKAREEANRLLAEIARASSRNDKKEVARLAAASAPRLAVLGPASMTMQRKQQYIAEARRQFQIHRPFIEELARRILSNPEKFRSAGGSLSKERQDEIARIVWGEGDNQLRHPFAPAETTTRGAADNEVTTRGISGIAFTIGVSGDAAFIVGIGAGGAGTWMIPPFSLLFENCAYGDAHATLGADVGAGGNIDVGFWGRMPNDLGGPDVSVEVGAAVLGDISVSFSFEQGDDGGVEFSGFSINPGVGGGFDVSLAMGYAHLVGCTNLSLT